ncbi:MAG: Ribosomal RNA small subunit methyltransferase A [Berkelbacteria bacterium GW2011_GWB1_38_5]|uniref:Ribosomal RNA small subunit methyltransferase A n=2 Tax=Candidatus Berkelbacteria TaxID=1618330 RepID=A0A0G0FGU0_9BACT|nr:MAG: Ribosomal RNA small subunit methyltransferase A [Berkelbacteria bacterium GW2011_GWA1_36_9]KKQ73725.1 MAG: Ribosomal RNA small subunit methyltransferase A [Berkelbacteria bacterium GW2011_GWB1_38_5]
MFKQKKSLGQNFLINDKIIPDIIDVSKIKKSDTVIEVGPGLGILTKALIDTGAKIYVIEKDFELVEMLRKAFGKNKNLTIIHQDALLFNIDVMIASLRAGAKQSKKITYKVVANLPFNIASPLIRKFLENENQPELMVVMVQKEVAEKIVAQPGNSERGILTLAVEFYAKAEIIQNVSKSSFRPQPKVDAAILKITPYPHTGYADMVEQVDSQLFFKIVKAGFASKRRQIHNSLSATLRLEKDKVADILKQAKIEPQLRAEDLTLKQWLALYNVLKNIF